MFIRLPSQRPLLVRPRSTSLLNHFRAELSYLEGKKTSLNHFHISFSSNSWEGVFMIHNKAGLIELGWGEGESL